MVAIAVRHKVADFDKWLEIYNNHNEQRVKHGQTNHTVYPSLKPGGDVLIITEWPSAEAFDTFAKEANLPEVMKDAGVTSPPEITVLGDPVG